jgi:hypothetical protein
MTAQTTPWRRAALGSADVSDTQLAAMSRRAVSGSMTSSSRWQPSTATRGPPARRRRLRDLIGDRHDLDQVVRGAAKHVKQRGDGVHRQPLRRLRHQPEDLLPGPPPAGSKFATVASSTRYAASPERPVSSLIAARRMLHLVRIKLICRW